jgi:hypothetical protein
MPTTVKWNSKGSEARYLTNLFIQQKVDLNNKKPEYIREVKRQHPIFAPFSQDRFVVNYRKLLSHYLIGKSKEGARKEGKLNRLRSLVYVHNYV